MALAIYANYWPSKMGPNHARNNDVLNEHNVFRYVFRYVESLGLDWVTTLREPKISENLRKSILTWIYY